MSGVPPSAPVARGRNGAVSDVARRQVTPKGPDPEPAEDSTPIGAQFQRAWSGTPSQANVKTSGPSAVTAIVCSKCAERRPSAVTTLQPSSSISVSGDPALTIGSP